MHRALTELPKAVAASRGGPLVRLVLFGVPLAAGVVLAGWLLLPRISWSSGAQGPLMHEVQRSGFVHEVTEKGSIESASNVEVRCEVQSMKSAGTMILEIVPEGTYVEKGDFLCRLDSSWLEADLVKQQITCATSEAAATEARNELETAEISKQEYLEGQYKLEEQKILSEILLAEQEDRRARENLAYSERLAAKGYITKLQLDAERFAVEKAANELKSAQLKLDVLEKYTRVKQLKELDSKIKTAQARLASREHSHKLDVEEMERMEEQVEKCVITAPEAGQVVYANETNRRGGSEVIIDEGELVREHQVLIRLPDPKRMQVDAKINEARISLVRPGMPASIRLDAFPDVTLTGEVQEVSDYPAPTSWYRGDVKEYQTIIHIDNPPPNLKPGLTAEVRIQVEDLDEVMQVPVQAILEYGPRHYGVVRNGTAWEARELALGPSNEKSVVVCDLVEVPVPVLFEFEGRPFALLCNGPRWESRSAEIVRHDGKTATVRLAGSESTTELPAVLELGGTPVHLLFDGAAWHARQCKPASEGGRYVASDESRIVPVQAVFDFDQKTYCLDCDYQHWVDAREEAEGPEASAPPEAGAKGPEPKSPKPDAQNDAEPDPEGGPEPAAGVAEEGTEVDRPASDLGPRVQPWTAREVTLGSDPAHPGAIGVGLRPGESVVLNAAAYREELELPEFAPEAKARRKPGPSARSRSAKSPGDAKKKEGKDGKDGKNPVQLFKQWDRNSDSKLSKDELPGPVQSRFSQLDKNQDGGIDLSEWAAAAAAMRAHAGKVPPGGPAQGKP